MTDLTQYQKGYSPSAIQRKYGLTYEQGYELAESFRELEERLKKTQELELELRKENAKLKELLKECRKEIDEDMNYSERNELGKLRLIEKIDEVLK